MVNSKFLIIPIIVIIGISAVFVLNNPNLDIQTEKVSETKPIKIASDKIIGGLPLFVMLDQGFLEKKDIEYTNDLFPTASQVAESLLAGKHDMGGPISIVDISIIESKNPGHFKLFAIFTEPSDSPISQIIVKSDSPIATVSELKGKKMAIAPGVTMDFLANTFVKKFFDVNEIELIPMPPGNWFSTLESGQVDAVYSLEPFTTIALEQGIAKVIYEGAESSIIDPLPIVGIAFTSEFVENNPQTAEKIVELVDDAVKIINEDPDQARKGLSAYTDLDENISNKVNLGKSYGPSDLDKIKGTLQKFADRIYEEGYMDSKIDVTNLLYQK